MPRVHTGRELEQRPYLTATLIDNLSLVKINAEILFLWRVLRPLYYRTYGISSNQARSRWTGPRAMILMLAQERPQISHSIVGFHIVH
jgi:sulfite reductase alpha subunit-like flavoprotein